jgi:hypothetical protein
MSYDIYLYKSKAGRPDEDEADQVIEADNDKWAEKEINPYIKLAIVKALTSTQHFKLLIFTTAILRSLLSIQLKKNKISLIT